MATVITGTGGIDTPKLSTISSNLGVVGDRRNMQASTTALSPVVSFSCDSHILADQNGIKVVKPLFSSTLDTRVVGIGGFVSSPPPSSWVAVYHVHNVSSGESNVIADLVVMSSASPDVLPNNKMPPGFTHSALICVVALDSASNFVPFTLRDRRVIRGPVKILDVTGAFTSGTIVDVSSFLPLNLNSVYMSVTCISATYPAGGWSFYALVSSVDGDSTTSRGEIAIKGAVIPTTDSRGVGSSAEILVTKTRQFRVQTGAAMSTGSQNTTGWLTGYTF